MYNIYLIGLMGSGKTAIGKILAKKIHRRFVDTDGKIEKEYNLPVAKIFANMGEAAFRDIETEVLRDLSKRKNRVVSTGGGAVLRKENIDLMRKSGKVIWLKRRPELILTGTRIHLRPLLAKDPNKIYDIAIEREPLYEAACDFVVINEGDKHKTVADILKKLRK
ncbi:MAG: shikimate kinase [Clostridiales bacterium]